jgi:precorrin-2 C20-methyltransferase / precorrin-3B C17-methyltransferase
MTLIDRVGPYRIAVIPGISGMSGCWAAAGVSMTHGNDVLTVLPATLEEEVLAARLLGTDAAVIMKLHAGAAHYAHGGIHRSSSSLFRAGAGPRKAAVAMTGRLDIVGLGPGDPRVLTPEAAEAVAKASDLVGYAAYLARLPVHPGQRRHASDNREELPRARHALSLAAAGRRVAVVSSGDPGVFGMAKCSVRGDRSR